MGSCAATYQLAQIRLLAWVQGAAPSGLVARLVRREALIERHQSVRGAARTECFNYGMSCMRDACVYRTRGQAEEETEELANCEQVSRSFERVHCSICCRRQGGLQCAR